MFGVSLEKKGSHGAVVKWEGGHGAFGPPPVGGPTPTYPYKNKNGKNQPFLAFHVFAPSPHPQSTTPPQTKNNLVQPLENLVLRLVKIFSGVKIHAFWRLVLGLKYSLE